MSHQSRFRLAVFDVAGTTVFDGDAVVDCLRSVIGSRADVPEEEVRSLMGLPKPVAIGRLLSLHTRLRDGALASAVDDVHEAFRAALIARYREAGTIAPVPRAEDVFSTLRAAGLCIALDTGFSRDILDAVLTQLGWAEGVIDHSIASDEVPRGRPFPDLILRAMLLAGVTEPAAVIKVGDTPADVDEGLAAQCGLVVGVTYGTHTRSQLMRDGVHAIDRIEELLPLALEGP